MYVEERDYGHAKKKEGEERPEKEEQRAVKTSSKQSLIPNLTPLLTTTSVSPLFTSFRVKNKISC